MQEKMGKMQKCMGNDKTKMADCMKKEMPDGGMDAAAMQKCMGADAKKMGECMQQMMSKKGDMMGGKKPEEVMKDVTEKAGEVMKGMKKMLPTEMTKWLEGVPMGKKGG